MKKTVDIMDYCNKLFAADLFASIVLEEDFDTGCDYTWSAAGDDWADKFRAELNGYVSAGCCAERAADYRKALAILDEMEQAAAEQNNAPIDYTARPIPGDYEGRSHRACVWYNRARAAFDLATLDALTTTADKAADRVPTEAYEKARKLLDSVQRWGLADARAWELDNDSRYYNSEWLKARQAQLAKRRVKLNKELAKYGLQIDSYGLYPCIREITKPGTDMNLLYWF